MRHSGGCVAVSEVRAAVQAAEGGTLIGSPGASARKRSNYACKRRERMLLRIGTIFFFFSFTYAVSLPLKNGFISTYRMKQIIFMLRASPLVLVFSIMCLCSGESIIRKTNSITTLLGLLSKQKCCRSAGCFLCSSPSSEKKGHGKCAVGLSKIRNESGRLR